MMSGNRTHEQAIYKILPILVVKVHYRAVPVGQYPAYFSLRHGSNAVDSLPNTVPESPCDLSIGMKGAFLLRRDGLGQLPLAICSA